jgi:hypothetical protein
MINVIGVLSNDFSVVSNGFVAKSDGSGVIIKHVFFEEV